MVTWLNGCTLCNDGIVVEIEERKRQGQSVRSACEEMAEMAAREFPELAEEFSAEGIRYRYRLHTGRVNRPGAKHPPTAEKVQETKMEIALDAISEVENIKPLDNALAGRVEKEKKITSGSATASAVHKVRKRNRKPKVKDPDNFKRLHKAGLQFCDGLRAWVGGEIKPDTLEEFESAKGVMALLPQILIHYVGMGIDINQVTKTYTKGSDDHEYLERKTRRFLKSQKPH